MPRPGKQNCQMIVDSDLLANVNPFAYCLFGVVKRLGLYHAAPHKVEDRNLIDLSRIPTGEVPHITNLRNNRDTRAVNA